MDETVLLERIDFLEARNTELQERNTSLVIENRELNKMIQEKERAVKICLELIKVL